MEKIIRSLYYMVEDWVGQHDLQGEEIKALEARQEALQEKSSSAWVRMVKI